MSTYSKMFAAAKLLDQLRSNDYQIVCLKNKLSPEGISNLDELLKFPGISFEILGNFSKTDMGFLQLSLASFENSNLNTGLNILKNNADKVIELRKLLSEEGKLNLDLMFNSREPISGEFIRVFFKTSDCQNVLNFLLSHLDNENTETKIPSETRRLA